MINIDKTKMFQVVASYIQHHDCLMQCGEYIEPIHSIHCGAQLAYEMTIKQFLAQLGEEWFTAGSDNYCHFPVGVHIRLMDESGKTAIFIMDNIQSLLSIPQISA